MIAHIGIDLDNTIIDYETVFAGAAQALGLIAATDAAAGKEKVKAVLRAGPGGEEAWMRLQGQVYGRFIGRATPYPGVMPFIEDMKRRGLKVSVVSHKTRLGHFDEHEVDLWEAARGWLVSQGLIGSSPWQLGHEDVHFLESRDAKIAQIAALRCDIFIDDLPEVLNDPSFPRMTAPLWFAHDKRDAEGCGLFAHRNWHSLAQAVCALLAK